LRAFSKRGELPSGLLPFFHVCLAAGNKQEALAYVQRMREPSERTICFGRLEMWPEAIEAAKAVKSEDVLLRLQAICNNAQAKAAIAQIIDSLQ